LVGLPTSVRRAALAAALVIAGTGAFAMVRRAVESVQGDVAGTGRVASAAVDVRGTRRPHGVAHRRDRARDFAVADEATSQAPATDGASGETVARAGAAPDVAARRTRLVADPTPNVADFALPAAPDRDGATNEAAAVAPGRAPELALAAFVADGAAVVRPVAELVGERKPPLDEGVPVSLTGRVVEAEGGAPIVGARLVVSSTFYVRRYFYDHHLREVARVETDGDGRYLIERLNVDPAHFGRGGSLFLTVTADGRAPALAVPLAAVSPGVANRLPDVALQRATQTLRGRVTDMWRGLPVVGARVFATGAIDPVAYPKDERAALFVGAPTCTTDGDGRFLLEGLGAGVQTISVHGGDDCVGSEPVALPHEGEFLMRARQIGGRIEGTTLDERGEPVSLVTIEGGDNSTHSFADGRFVLENFRGDVVSIRFTHPDYAPVVVADVRNGAAGLVVHMERPRPTIVLDVRDPDTSAPVARVQLEMTFAEGRPPPAATSPQRLAADGKYAVRVPEGATSVSVAAEGRASEAVPLAGRVDGEIVRVLLAGAYGR
jgi:hypothetical protein